MKSKILITGAILCAITTTSAHAVTKCVALNSSTTCTSSYSQYLDHTDWAATCTTNGVSTPIRGIGICSSTKGVSTVATTTTATELDTSYGTEENNNCWCRMISPAVSRWVFGRSGLSAGDCATECAYSCAFNARDSNFPAFRSALFGSLSD